ncbi:hypothetical protein [Pseudomonas sp. Larv2_ips]|uniref:hypothetical protein n=1 Tax=Pseudomonas sp. Larv2_ips TaxID=1896942 RepID=UPI000E6D2BCC|nr:hypothetical protein [Pseudomonas sp. Larv2_ips]
MVIVMKIVIFAAVSVAMIIPGALYIAKECGNFGLGVALLLVILAVTIGHQKQKVRESKE